MASTAFTCRWAALSLSSIAGVFIPDIQIPRDSSESINHELVVVSTTGSSEKAHQWFQEHKIQHTESVQIYHDWQRMLEQADFDVVYISTPHPLHYQHVKFALEQKRNVLVEKPATMNAAQFEKLSKLAERQGVVLMEAMWTRYLPAATYLQRELLPRIGQIKRVYADFSFPIVSPDLPHSSRFLDKAAGAGSLLDQGVYALTWVDIAFHGTGKSSTETKVEYANTISVPGVPGEVDDMTTVVLSNRNGQLGSQQATGIVTTSMTLPGSSEPTFYRRLQAKKAAPSVRIEGTEAAVAIPFPPIRPQELHVQWYGAKHLEEGGIEREESIEKPVEYGWGMWYQADVIASRVRKAKSGEEGEVIGGQETLRILKWMDEARRKAGIHYDAALDQV